VKPNLTGITAAGTVPDSHRIPLHCDNGVITITTKFRRKGITFFQTHQIFQRLNNLKTISEKPFLISELKVNFCDSLRRITL
jgi:hypothetical protein